MAVLQNGTYSQRLQHYNRQHHKEQTHRGPLLIAPKGRGGRGEGGEGREGREGEGREGREGEEGEGTLPLDDAI